MKIKEIHQSKAEAIINYRKSQLNHTPCDELMANKFVDFDGKIKYVSELDFNNIDFWKGELLPTGHYLEA